MQPATIRHPIPGRAGVALIMSVIAVTLLMAISFALSAGSVANMQQQSMRKSQISLQIAADSAANEAILWMSTTTGLSTIQNLPASPTVVTNAQIGSTGTYNPETFNTNVQTLYNTTASAVIDSSTTSIYGTTLASGGSAISEPGWGVNLRNSCTVNAKIVCLATTASGDSFPDGNERYLVLVTAQMGNASTGANTYMRRRVVTLMSASATHVFSKDMYAVAGYDVGGNAGTDSWPGPPAVYVPADAGNVAMGYDNGDVASGGTVTTSGSSNVDGTITSNVSMALPSFTYAPPSSATALGAVSSTTTLTGPTTVRMTSFSADLVISGSGTVNLYCDGPFNANSITFSSGSTASCVIMQNSYSSALGGSGMSLKSVVGDVSSSGGHYTANPARLEYITNAALGFSMNGNGMMAAVVYAPYCTFAMKGTFQFFGSIVGDSFGGKVNGTFNFHYDNALANLSLPLNVQLASTMWNSYTVSAGQQ